MESGFTFGLGVGANTIKGTIHDNYAVERDWADNFGKMLYQFREHIDFDGLLRLVFSSEDFSAPQRAAICAIILNIRKGHVEDYL